MNLSDLPAWFAKRFAADATGTYVRAIPTTTADPAAASLSLGFPPDTFTDIGAGGTPPDGRDFNGILNQLSAWSQWAGVGGAAPWSSTISAAAGGYPLGAIVLSGSVTGRQYQSQVNANVTNPDTGGAGWAILVDKAASPDDITAGTSNELVVTPLGLVTRGYDPVVAQSLISNGGFRRFASGYMECWGTRTVSAASTTVIAYPAGGYTLWSNPTVTGVRNPPSSNDDNNPGVISAGTASFSVRSDIDVSVPIWWNARGF